VHALCDGSASAHEYRALGRQMSAAYSQQSCAPVANGLRLLSSQESAKSRSKAGDSVCPENRASSTVVAQKTRALILALQFAASQARNTILCMPCASVVEGFPRLPDRARSVARNGVRLARDERNRVRFGRHYRRRGRFQHWSGGDSDFVLRGPEYRFMARQEPGAPRIIPFLPDAPPTLDLNRSTG
jgi:hypothetical protein